VAVLEIGEALERAGVLRRAGRLREAETLCRRVLLQAPGHAEALTLLGLLLAGEARGEEAGLLLRNAAAAEPGSPERQTRVGHGERLRGDLGAAEACYRNALRFDAAQEEALLSLGTLLEEQERWAEAERLYRGRLQQEPAAEAVAARFCRALEIRGRGAEAAETLQRLAVQAREGGQETPAPWRVLGALRLRLGQPEAALGAFRRAQALDPDCGALRRGVAAALAAAGDLGSERGGALAAWRTALAAEPQDAQAHLGLLRCLLRLERHEEALAAAQRAGELPEAPARLFTLTGGLLARLGEGEAALRVLARALALDPREVRAYLPLAPLLHASGRGEEAARLFDFRRFVWWRRLGEVPDHGSVEAFDRELAAWLRGRGALAPAPGERVGHGAWRSGPLFGEPGRALRTLAGLCRQAARDYLARHAGAADNPFLAEPPARLRLLGEGLLLRASGYLDPHVHPESYLSGVYYAEVPGEVAEGEGEAGCLRFLDSPAAGALRDHELIRPKPGLLVLFPAYFWHGTVPFRSLRERLSIGFDLVDADHPHPSRAPLGDEGWE